MFSLNQVKKKLSDIAAAHLQINSFGLGDVWEISASNPPTYPLMWAAIQPSSVNDKSLSLKISLLFMDLVHKDEGNEDEVLSDQLQIALDVFAELKKPENEDNYIMDNSANLEPFTERFDDEVSGWKMDINLKIHYLSDRCAVPQ